MQNLFFVSVAIGIFSGTSLSAKAQTAVNMEQVNASEKLKSSPKFIEGIEIKPLQAKSVTTVKETVEIKRKAEPQIPVIDNEYSAIENCSSLQFKYALLLDMDVEAVTNRVLFDEIEKWWDTRYRYGGTTAKGIDCSAYTGTLLADVYGLNVQRTSRAQFAESEKIERDDLQQGDLVFFNTRRRGRGVSHVGLYLGNGYFTHAGSSTGVTISSLNEIYWSRKYIGAGRVQSTVSD